MALPETRHELPGWALLWARLAVHEAIDAARLDAVVAVETERLRRGAAEGPLSELPVVAAVRSLFRRAGTDPTRYRPSSEALARRVVKGQELPRIAPAVDLNNLVSVRLMLPCCVMRERTLAGPFVLRRGAGGESMESLRGPFPLDGKPLLADALGPFSTPITDSRRVPVDGTDRSVLLVVYAPAERAGSVEIAAALDGLARATGVAEVRESAWSAGPGSAPA